MIDSHAHLNEIEDVDAALTRAREAGITSIVAVGMDLASNQATLELHRRFPGLVYAAVGYHPWSITPESIEENLDFIREHLAGHVGTGRTTRGALEESDLPVLLGQRRLPVSPREA